MKQSYLLASALFLLFTVFGAQAQDGNYDPTFNTPQGSYGILKVMPNDMIISAFDQELIRLLPDGAIDNTFNVGSGFNGDIYDIVIQPQGKIMVSGNFDMYNGQSVPHLVRLLENGTLDPSFHAMLPSNFLNARSIRPLANGGFIVSGSLIGSSTTLSLVRLQEDGSADSNFSTYTLPNVAGFFEFRIQSDNKIVLASSTLVNGNFLHRIIRLQANGNIDGSYDIEANNFLEGMAIQNDDKLLLSGRFTQLGGTPVNPLVRLLPDGSVDASFQGDGAPVHGIYSIFPLSGDYLFVAGTFSLYDGLERRCLARIAPDGSLDALFDPGTGFAIDGGEGLQTAIGGLQSTGKLMVYGSFTEYNGHTVYNIVRLTNSILNTAEAQSAHFAVYPNPTSGRIFLTSSSATTIDGVLLYNTMGQEVLRYSGNPKPIESMDVGYLPSGIYTIIIQHEGLQTVRRFIKN